MSMISPEGYYQTSLKGKSKEEILSEIRSLKRHINQLKRAAEDPEFEDNICPSVGVRLSVERDYLARAIEAYEEAGGTYQPTRAELKERAFDQALEHMSKLMFRVSGFFQGFETRTVTISGDDVNIHVDSSPFGRLPDLDLDQDFSRNKKEFIEELKDIRIGNWKKEYIDLCVLDGTQWELEIRFSNGRRAFKTGGSNAYPYNFDQLMALLEVDDEWIAKVT